MSDTSHFDNYLADVQSRMDGYCSTGQANQQKFDVMVKTLSDLVLSSNSSPTSEPTPVMAPNTESPHFSDTVLCDPYVSYTNNLITDTYKHSLESIITEN